MTRPVDQSCRSCRFWFPSRRRFTDREGTCRRHAPTAPSDICDDPVFPMVDGDFWCGDYGEIVTFTMSEASVRNAVDKMNDAVNASGITGVVGDLVG